MGLFASNSTYSMCQKMSIYDLKCLFIPRHSLTCRKWVNMIQIYFSSEGTLSNFSYPKLPSFFARIKLATFEFVDKQILSYWDNRIWINKLYIKPSESNNFRERDELDIRKHYIDRVCDPLHPHSRWIFVNKIILHLSL